MKRLLALLALPLIIAGCATPSQMVVDAEVKRLCAIDGGVKVYEAVKLPATEFDQWGMPKTYQKRIQNKAAYQHDGTRTVMEFFLGSDYIVRYEVHIYRGGEPDYDFGVTRMWRNFYQVIRRGDGVVLGETVSYSRRGGDIPGPWHPSSYRCPERAGDTDLIQQLFVR
jgi:hypothetical protein